MTGAGFDSRIAIDSARGDKLPANAPLQLGDVITRGPANDPAGHSVWRVVRVWRLAPPVAARYGWADPHSAWKATLTSADEQSPAFLTIALDPPTSAELDVPGPRADR